MEPEINNYKFCYYEDQPSSLAIIKHPSLIYENLYQQGDYVWIANDTHQLKYSSSEIQQKAELKINFVKSIEDLELKYQNKNTKIVIISHISLINQIQDVLQPMFETCRILCLVFYGNNKGNKKTKRTEVNNFYVDSQQRAISQIKNDKKYYSTGNFVNFISLDKQKRVSNNLIKTMFTMIRQQTNTINIMEEFKKLALLCHEEDQQYIEQLVQQYTQNNHLTDDKAVWWYTRESFLYRFVNRILRILKDPICLFIIQPYFQDLFNNVRKLYAEQQKQKKFQFENHISNYINFTCYRGAEISDNEIKFFSQNKDSFIQNLGFMSTSRDRNSAKQFAKNVIFEIVVNQEKRKEQIDYGFADLNKFNNYGEAQILFNPLNSFKITDFSFDQLQKIYKIRLKYGQMARLAISQDKLSEKQLNLKWLAEHQIRESQQCKRMGDILVQNSYNLEGCHEYCDKFIDIASKYQNYDAMSHGYYLRGAIAKNKGDYKTMQAQLIKQLEIQEIILSGCTNEDQIQIKKKIQTTLNNLGMSFDSLGQYQKSFQYYQRCLQIKNQLYGENHPNYAVALNNLASSLNNLGQYQEAMEYYKKCQEIQRKILGESHPNYAITLNNLGMSFDKLGQFKTSIDYYKRCQKIQRQVIGENHPNYATTLNNLGMSFNKLGQYQKAIDYYQRSQKIRLQILGENHPDYATSLNNLASLFYKMGQYQKALENYKRCQKIQIQIFGGNHPQYASTLNNFAYVYSKIGQFQKSLECAMRSGDQQTISMVEQITEKIQKFQKYNQSQMKSESLKLQKLFHRYLKQKQYESALIQLEQNLAISKVMKNSHFNLLVQKVEFLLKYFLSGISKLIGDSLIQAGQLMNQQKYQQAQQIFSVEILEKYKYLWRHKLQIMCKIESKIQIIQQKIKKRDNQKYHQQILLKNHQKEVLDNKKKDIIEVIQQKQEVKEQLGKSTQISNDYYLDVCKNSVQLIITNISINPPFEFQLYNQVILYIEEADIPSAVSGMKIIQEEQKKCLQLKSQNSIWREAIIELNNLFNMMIDFYDVKKGNSSEKFKESHKKLKAILSRQIKK